MITLLIVALVISQLLCFYFIILLNSKISKFKLIEKNQETLIEQMEDSFSLYLIEMKEENNRLIKELNEVSTFEKAKDSIQVEKSAQTASKRMNDDHIEVTTLNNEVPDEVRSTKEIVKIVPKFVATNAYKSSATSKKTAAQVEQSEVLPINEALTSFEQQVVSYYKGGLSVEEIAKKTQKGKTEIELLIKFHA